MSFRKNVPYNIGEDALTGAAWTLVLGPVGVQRLGELQGTSAFQVEVAPNNTPAASEIVIVDAEPREFLLPAYASLYARLPGSAPGPGELHGTLWAE